MTDLGLIQHNLFRKKLRAILMIVTIMVAFLLFGMLAAFSKSWNSFEDTSAADRLVTVNRINLTVSLPYAYASQVRTIEGVRNVTWATWFEGYYQEQRNFVQTMAVDPETYLIGYPELVVPEDQRRDFISDRSSMLVGDVLAKQFGWKVGDVVPLRSGIYTNSEDGSNAWSFRVAGIFSGAERETITNYVLFHWERLNESATFGRDVIGWMILNTEDAARNDEIAAAIDARFANSQAETETTTEAAFNRGFVEQIGNINLIINLVVGAAFATILMIVGTTMIMAIRERTKEIAVMKTIGFRAPRIFGLILGETLLLSLIGGLLGLGLAALAAQGASAALAAFLPGIAVTPDIALIALALMVALGLVTGLAPAIGATRVEIAAALGKE
jgi:putative ABC transport system permease protein